MSPKSDSEININSWLEDELISSICTTARPSTRVGRRSSSSMRRRATGRRQTFRSTRKSRAWGTTGSLARRVRSRGAQYGSQPVHAAGYFAAHHPGQGHRRNRRIINQHRTLVGKSKVSYTHLIGWAIVKAVKSYPGLNHAYTEMNGEPFRVVREQINLESPSTWKERRRAQPGRSQYQERGRNRFSAVRLLIRRPGEPRAQGQAHGRGFQSTTISLTNPARRTMGSIPRLLPGQGAIIAAGAIDYPAEYQGVAPEVRASLGISKVMTLTCTYDHRIIQGAESGMFLGKAQGLLEGAENFYEEVFAHLKMPHQPVRWAPDRQPALAGLTPQRAEAAKEAAVIQLINAYRVRGHLIADLDPLGVEPSYHPELDPATYGLTIWDLDREFLTGSFGEAIGEGAPQPVATLREILETLRRTYCGKVGIEYMNIQHPPRSAGCSSAWNRMRITSRLKTRSVWKFSST